MNDLFIVFGCVGLAHLFVRDCQPYLNTGNGNGPPFAWLLILLFGYTREDEGTPGLFRTAMRWNVKPWNCWLCMSGWAGLVGRWLWNFAQPPEHIAMFFLAPLLTSGAAWLLAHWLSAVIDYYSLLSKV